MSNKAWQDRGVPRIGRSATRRAELLNAALSVVRRDGRAASMEAIASAAGVSKPILYRHFGDRDGLVAAVAEVFGAGLVERLTAALHRPQPPAMTLADAIRAYVRFIDDDTELYQYLAEHTAVGGSAYRAIIDDVAATIAAALEPRRAAVEGTSTTETWAYGIAGMVHLAGGHWVRTRHCSLEELVDDLVALIWDGMAAGLAERDATDDR